jgi:hypothetical protein
VIPVLVMAYLFWQNTKPVLDMNCDFEKKTALCGELVPVARTAADEDGILIKEEPVYFDVRIPRKYDKVEVAIEYSGLGSDIFEFGISRDAARKNFDFVTLENRILDNLNWQKSEDGGLVLYQKKPVYKSVAEFLAKSPVFGETRIYRADAAPKLPVLWARGETTIDFPIREGLKMLVYKKDGEPKVVADGDELRINIFSVGTGLYKIEIIGAKETMISRISVDSPYVAILDGIKFGELAKPAEIYLAGSRVLAKTETASGAQKIKIGEKEIDVAATHKQYAEIFKDAGTRKISVPRGNVELGGTMFFLNQKNLFYPRYEVMYAGADFSSVNFVLAKYVPAQTGETKTGRAAFDISGTPTPGSKLRFLLSLPGANSGELINIKSIKLKFIGQQFGWPELFNKLMKITKLKS